MDAKKTDIPIILSLMSSMFLCKPTKAAIQNWKAVLSEDVPELISDLKDAIHKIDLNSEQELDDILWEYTRLFIGPYKLPCPPWESVYTSPKRLMMQSAYEEVQDFYHEIGLEIDNTIMPDHIGVELNFLAILYEKMNEEHTEKGLYRKMAKKLLNEHLMKWISQFTLDMKKAANSLFYKTLAQSTRDLIHWLCTEETS